MVKKFLPFVVILGLIVITRIVLPWGEVMGSGTIRFACPDSYYHANLISQLCATFPSASSTHLFSYNWFVAGLVQIAPEYKDVVIAFVPVIVALLTAILVYRLGIILCNKTVGIVAAVIFLLLPGEYLSRSILGAADLHATEVFLTTLLMLCLFAYFKTENLGRKPLYLVGAIFAFILYFEFWQGALMFAIIIGGAVVAWLVLNEFGKSKKWGVLTSIGAGVLAVYVFIAVFPRVYGSTSFALTAEAIPFYGEPISFLLIFKLFTALTILGYLVKVSLNNWSPATLLFIVWAGGIIVATMIQRRFDYYLAVPLALLIGFAVAVAGIKMQSKVYIPALLMAGACLFFLPWSVRIASDVPFAPSDEWVGALEWVKDNSDQEAVVMAWWDYGYWIEYIAEREAFVNPSQNEEKVKQVAGVLTSDDLKCKEVDVIMKVEYLMIDEETAGIKFPAIVEWNGGKGHRFMSLAYGLYHEGQEELGLDLVYDKGVKIWAVEKSKLLSYWH